MKGNKYKRCYLVNRLQKESIMMQWRLKLKQCRLDTKENQVLLKFNVKLNVHSV